MACYIPIPAYKSREYGVTFKPVPADYILMDLPCGQCIGCRLERSRQWALRCVHEMRYHEQNCFITLTYNEQNVPQDYSLHYPDFQKFMKRLRKTTSTPLKFFMCGEYGENTLRPHYHACLFGTDFQDKIPIGRQNEIIHYTSPSLEKIWGLGNVQIGELNFQTAAYTARYITKKLTGEPAKTRYNTDLLLPNGLIVNQIPEFCQMSRKEGIGKKYLQEFYQDYLNDDTIVHDGQKMRAPKYYDRLIREEKIDVDLQQWQQNVENRIIEKKKLDSEEIRDKRDLLQIKETIKIAQITNIKRGDQ